MKRLIKNFVPQIFKDFIIIQRGFFDYIKLDGWRKRGFLEHSPQIVKQNIFLKYGLKDAVWVESGTHLGITTEYLSNHFPHIYSIEPEPKLYASARKRFEGKNVTLFNDISENIFKLLLPKLSGCINFWLDGHFSAGITFKGKKTVLLKMN